MAQRRMFSNTITDSDLFMDMPKSAQLLYFHLNMHADDDGFVGNTKSIMRMTGSSDDDLKILLAKQYLIPFENGVTVIKDWHIHNYIRSDRKHPTKYTNELKQLELNEDASYSKLPFGSQVSTNGQPNDGHLVGNCHTEVRLGKDRLGKVSKGKYIEPDNPKPKKVKPVRHKYGQYQNVLLTDEQLEKLKSDFPSDWQDRIERVSGYVQSSGKHYKDYLATIRNWAKRDQQSNQSNKVAPQTREDWFG
ncbi:replisome organizer [Lactiplantibacillus plantarum]|uniref:replisome organizer n=1 Tax=Lactiplantibacillus plantarum TaxID=1590 RepID=UPI0009777FBC|nr:replisome organizer [Lactiplantibacillus plantarum]